MDAAEKMPEGEELEKLLSGAYRLYQENIRETGALIYDFTKGARSGLPEKDLLEIAVQALEKCRAEL